jgi:MFS family permease
VVALLVVTGLLVVIQLYVGIPLATVVGADLHGGDASAALTTGFGLGYACGFLLFGTLSDHLGRRPLLVYGLAGLAATTACAGVAGSIEQIAILRFVQGFAAASFPAVAIAYLGETLAGRARTMAIGALSAAFLVASIVGQVYASALADRWGWRSVFWIEAPVFALLAAAIASLLAEPDRGRASHGGLGKRFVCLGPLARRSDLARVYVAGFVLLFALVAMYQGLGPELRRRYGVDAAGLQAVRLAGLPGMLVGPLVVALGVRREVKDAAAAGLVLAAGAVIGQSALSGAALWLPVLGSALFVLGVGLAVPALIATLAERAGGARGAAAALYSATAFAGASVAPLAVGSGLAFAPLMLIVGAGLASAAWCVRS